MAEEKPIRCLEFFSGIGGLHYALEIANINAQVVGAFDVNETANKVYQYNFKQIPSKKTIDRLTIKDIEKYNAACWLLSPPCQPYTRGGHQKDMEDPRSKAILHLIDLLPKLEAPPRYLFLENVKNFETSQTRERLVRQLDKLGYAIDECLLTPTQFGIPNHRMRYYLTARKTVDRDEMRDIYFETSKIQTTWPFAGQVECEIPPLSQFLEDAEKINQKTMVPERFILRLYKFRLDIVTPTDTLTSCVTKAYGSHHIQTSGSLVQTKDLECTQYNWDDTPSLLSFGLRFLSPTEISRLHAFPGPSYTTNKNMVSSATNCRPFEPPCCLPYLEFPDDTTQIQQYRLLGNSLNCWVVAELYRCVLFA